MLVIKAAADNPEGAFTLTAAETVFEAMKMKQGGACLP
jgi:hypothetical protein